jgi:hypothetical protein
MSTLRVNNITDINGNALTFGKVAQVVHAKTTDTSQTSDSGTGFVPLSVTITPKVTTSRILIMACLFGWSGDDSTCYLEYNIAGGSWVKDTTLNGQGTYGGFGDHSWSHRSNNGPMGNSIMLVFSPATTSAVGVRIRATSENGGAGGFWLNGAQMPTTAGGDYNSASAISSLTVMEISA